MIFSELKGLSLIALSLGLVLLSACAVNPPLTEQPGETPAPSESPTVIPSITESAPTPEPTAAASEPAPTGDSGQSASEAARQHLAAQNGASLESVTVLSIEPVEWPNACLGIPTSGVMCAEVITPGYRITLSWEGREYIYHTDISGSQVRLAHSQSETPETSIEWSQGEGASCESAVISMDVIVYGACEGPKQQNQITSSDRGVQAGELLARYARFEAETPAGRLIFRGSGDAVAAAVEQRSIAEWARMVYQETGTGGEDPSRGVVLAWSREGGIAGFCDSVTIYLNGLAYGGTCRGPAELDLGPAWLSVAQLEKIYAWVDRLQSFERGVKDPAKADAMQVNLAFTGSGGEQASPEDIQAMQDLAVEVLDQLRFSPESASLAPARSALETYFAALREASFASAASLYGGDTQVLVDWNPDIDPGDLPALFKRGCTSNGLVCGLSVRRYIAAAQTSASDIRFTVELSNPDGTLFTRGPCCGEPPQTNPPETQFVFTLRGADQGYLLLDLPVYIP